MALGLNFLPCPETGLQMLGGRSCVDVVDERPLSSPVVVNEITVGMWVLLGPGAIGRSVSHSLDDCGPQKHFSRIIRLQLAPPWHSSTIDRVGIQ